jgi:excisionase family DNA binding protein
MEAISIYPHSGLASSQFHGPGRAELVTQDRDGHVPRRRLSVEEAAPILGVSVFMVRALIRQRAVPYYRVGRRIVLDAEDLERYLRKHRVEAREP